MARAAGSPSLSGTGSRMGCLPSASRPARRDESVSTMRRLGSSPHPRRNSRHWRRSPVPGRSPAPVPPSPEQLRNLPGRPIRHVRRAIRGAVDPPAIGVAIHGIVGMRIHRRPRSVASLPARGRTLPRPEIDAPRRIRLERFVEPPAVSPSYVARTWYVSSVPPGRTVMSPRQRGRRRRAARGLGGHVLDCEPQR